MNLSNLYEDQEDQNSWTAASMGRSAFGGYTFRITKLKDLEKTDEEEIDPNSSSIADLPDEDDFGSRCDRYEISGFVGSTNCNGILTIDYYVNNIGRKVFADHNWVGEPNTLPDNSLMTILDCFEHIYDSQ